MNRSVQVPARTVWAFRVILILSCLSGFSLGGSVAVAQEEGSTSIDFKIGQWFLKAKDMDILISDSVGTGPVLGQPVDFNDTFGVDDGVEPSWSVKALIGYKGALFIRGGYQEIRLEGNAPINSPVQFAGFTMQPGTNADASTRLDFFEVGLQYNIINSTELKLGLLIEPKIMNFRARVSGVGQEGVTGPIVPFYEKEEEILAIPLVGLTAELRPFDWLGLRGEVKAMRLTSTSWLSGLDGDLTAYDWEAGLTLYLGEPFAISAGYRALSFDMELDQSGARKTKADLKFNGWFAALDLQF